MTAPHATDIISGYLARLDGEAADLPRRERRELIAGIREHIAEARAAMPEETDADVLNLLDRLGDPADVASDERYRLGLRVQSRAQVGMLEIGALVLTPLFWPVGVILLWASSAWNVRDKLIGTLIPPGGLFVSLIVFGLALSTRGQVCHSGSLNGARAVSTCSGGLQAPEAVILPVVFIILIVSPIITGIYMAVRLRRRTRSSLNPSVQMY
jgi:uncharacterized membrane protein